MASAIQPASCVRTLYTDDASILNLFRAQNASLERALGGRLTPRLTPTDFQRCSVVHAPIAYIDLAREGWPTSGPRRMGAQPASCNEDQGSVRSSGSRP